ncbi:hypothetical protein [Shinella sp.]|uniref:hypothetical protein n=1 Tax=Shinella sp. TaxID=1870904 RepID=UPI003D2A368F
MNIKKLARQIAIEAKLHNCTDGDYGFLYDDEYVLTDAEWKAVCDEVDLILPTVEPTKAQWIEHSAAMRGFSTIDPIYSDT